jgi:hypothetical protein
MAIHTGRALVRLDLLVGLPHLPFADTKWLGTTHYGPPLAGCRVGGAGRRCPFGPVPLQNLPPYYGRLRPCVPRRYSRSCGGCRLRFSLGIGMTGSYVPYQSLDQGYAAFMPDASWVVGR